MEINTEKIGQFLSELSEADRFYLSRVLSVSDTIRSLINKYKLTPEFVCEKFDLRPKQYVNFVCGNYDYDLKHLAKLNALYVELGIKALEENVPVQVSKKEDL